MKALYLTSLIILFFLGTNNVFAQSKKEKRKEKKKVPQKGSVYISPVPVIGVNPAFGFIYGAGTSTSWYMGEPKTTKLSSALLGIAYTTKHQLIFTIKSTMYLENNEYILLGDWRYLNSSQPTWGIGTGPQSAKLASNDFEFDDGSITGNPEADLLKFQFIRFYETVLKKIGNKGFYAGLGLHIDIFRDFVDPLLDLDTVPQIITPFYAYNDYYGFSQEESNLIGISFNGIYDTRDNVNNTWKGRYAYISFTYNPKFLGSDKSSTTLWLEYRDYVNFTKNHNNILAIWTYANLTTSGKLPYMNLPAIGWDQYGRSGTPYAQGRFRGFDLLYLGVEYRKHLLRTKKNPRFFGMILFANATTANGRKNGIKLFEYIEPGYGLGLRFNLSQKSRTDIGIDYGWGNYGTTGLFIRLNENF